MGDSLQVCLGLASDLWPPEMQNQITETTSYPLNQTLINVSKAIISFDTKLQLIKQFYTNHHNKTERQGEQYIIFTNFREECNISPHLKRFRGEF